MSIFPTPYPPGAPDPQSGPCPDDRRAYLAEALDTARLMAGTLAYLLRTNQRDDGTEDDEALCAVLRGLNLQARRVTDLLEDIGDLT